MYSTTRVNGIEYTLFQTVAPGDNNSMPSPPNCPRLVNNNYEFLYSCSMAKEAAILAAFSLLLTVLNIICIIIMGIIVLKVNM